jgi:predicted pyridoxine 5'-phosphate oxidase superfamily flavin-nucleotide-binding protein
MNIRPSSDVAFSPAVKAAQAQRGSREAYARMEARGGWPVSISAELAAFIGATRSFFLATASADGQPYLQHRGGPPGFLHVLDDHTLGFADFRGNRQYITTGNLAENPRVCLFLMDYGEQRRVKIWGRARVDTDPVLIARLFPDDYDAKAEQAIVIEVDAWSENCSQHIPHLVPAPDDDAP